ncbi:hypothetical protein [Tissierella sp. Yu-01]|uniref:hypothetical protein n=1 Tax=Tissierella sp. Yu-01 TaxID=3035694 RepID=UPI00240DF583|nr:hypothetical protein [Tissierella sp. Yu-01]WFA10325.1 hypothetical protein P3962_07175 [Tissierella sp. Yu-01]
MAWQEPKMDWEAADVVSKDDFNRIEGNIKNLQDNKMEIEGAVTSVLGRTGDVVITKTDVGLGNVQNYGIATKTEAEAGTSNTKYVTPMRLKEAIAVLGLTPDIITPSPGNIYVNTWNAATGTGALTTDATSYSEMTGTRVIFDFIKPGRVRFRYSVSGANSGIGYARVYKNGSPIGIVREAPDRQIVWYSEDFDVAPGDVFSLYGYSTKGNGYTVNVSRFRLGFAQRTLFLTNLMYSSVNDPSFP